MGGVDGVRSIAKAKGAWTIAVDGGSARPLPGDVFGLSDSRDGLLTHVGIIVDAAGSTWRTADAGQGTHEVQKAEYVTRSFSSDGPMLGGPGGSRILAGWLNLDAEVWT